MTSGKIADKWSAFKLTVVGQKTFLSQTFGTILYCMMGVHILFITVTIHYSSFTGYDLLYLLVMVMTVCFLYQSQNSNCDASLLFFHELQGILPSNDSLRGSNPRLPWQPWFLGFLKNYYSYHLMTIPTVFSQIPGYLVTMTSYH